MFCDGKCQNNKTKPLTGHPDIGYVSSRKMTNKELEDLSGGIKNRFISWICTKCMKEVESVDERTGRCPDCEKPKSPGIDSFRGKIVQMEWGHKAAKMFKKLCGN